MIEPQTVRGPSSSGRCPSATPASSSAASRSRPGDLPSWPRAPRGRRDPSRACSIFFYLADFQYQPARSGEMHTLREVKPRRGASRSAQVVREPHRRAIFRRAHRDDHRIGHARCRRVRAFRQGADLSLRNGDHLASGGALRSIASSRSPASPTPIAICRALFTRSITRCRASATTCSSNSPPVPRRSKNLYAHRQT